MGLFAADHDKYNLLYFTLLFLGASMLFSYNAFISSPDYMKNFYKYASGDRHYVTQMSVVWDNMENLIVVCTMVPNFILQCFVVTSYGQRLSLHGRLTIGLSVIGFSLLIVAVLPVFKVGETAALTVLLLAVMINGGATAFFQSSAFAFASHFPEHFIQGTMLGIGVSGSSCSLLQIITKASLHGSFEDQRTQAYLFYGIAVVWIVLCLASIIVLRRNPFVASYVPEYREAQRSAAEKAALADPTAAAASALLTDDRADQPDLYQSENGDFEAPKKHMTLDGTAADDATPQKPKLGHVLKVIFPMMLANFLTFGISLVVFPGVGAMVDSSSSWYGVIIVFLFNAGDMSGRFVCRFKRLWVPPKIVVGASFVRFILVPLFVICIKPHWIPWAGVGYVLMFITGITNGYFGSLCMIYGGAHPDLEDHERGVAGSAMSVSLLGGASCGSLLDLLLAWGLKQ